MERHWYLPFYLNLFANIQIKTVKCRKCLFLLWKSHAQTSQVPRWATHLLSQILKLSDVFNKVLILFLRLEVPLWRKVKVILGCFEHESPSYGWKIVCHGFEAEDKVSDTRCGLRPPHWFRRTKGSFPAQKRLRLDVVGLQCSEEFFAGGFVDIRGVGKGGCFLFWVPLD